MPYLNWDYEGQHRRMQELRESDEKEEMQKRFSRKGRFVPTDRLPNETNDDTLNGAHVPGLSTGVHVSIGSMLALLTNQKEKTLQDSRDTWRRSHSLGDLAKFLWKVAHRADETSMYYNKTVAREFRAVGAANYRRTLHQSHYWSVNSSCYDRQQVVGELTAPIPEFLLWQRSLSYSWSEERRKTARLLMVDQAWMWIVGRDTLITCFPERYGIRPDENSSVHAILRRRLRGTDLRYVTSAFDLATMVSDELCSLGLARLPEPSVQRIAVLEIFSALLTDIVSIRRGQI